MAKATTKAEFEITPIVMGRIRACLLGTAPMYMHRMGWKAQGQILFPKGRANAAERASTLKHDPLGEFRESIYLNRDPKEPAAIHIPPDSFQKGLAFAALDLPGLRMAQILRLVTIRSTQINVFGIPQLKMDIVRMADMSHTPDIRTRAIFPEWACTIEIEHVSSLIKQNQIVNLLAAAGVIVGVGDRRPQKGGAYGKYKVVDENDPDYQRIIQQQGRAPQLVAIAKPVMFDADSEELFAWYHEEAARREMEVPSATAVATAERSSRRNGKSQTKQ
jgi:hypothetical protein